MATSRYPRGEHRRLRALDDALIDEEGARLDVDAGFDGTTLDAVAIAAGDRHVHLDGRSAPMPISAAELTRLAEIALADDDLWLVRYVGGGQTIIGIDTTDCPA